MGVQGKVRLNLHSKPSFPPAVSTHKYYGGPWLDIDFDRAIWARNEKVKGHSLWYSARSVIEG